MKYLSLLITYIFTANLLWSCSFENHLKPKKALVTGYISNFDKYSNKNWIDFVAPDLFSMEFPRVPIEIKPDGSFRYELDLVSPARCWGIYNKWFDFVISPGDSINLAIDANIWKDQTINAISKGEYVKISGTVKDDYFKIINFEIWAGDSIYTSEYSGKKNEAVKMKSSQEFKQFIQNNEKHVLRCIKDFGEKENAGDLFYNILNEEIKYRTLDDLMRYWWLNPLENRMKFTDVILPDNYFLFLDNYKMDNKDFYVEQRIDFIKELQFFLQFQNYSERKTFSDIYQNRKNKAKISDEYFRIQAINISRKTKGITRDLSLHFFALYNLDKVPEQSDQIFTSVYNLIKDPYVKKQFSKNFNSFSEKNKPPDKLVKKDESTAFDSIISKNHGKVLYVDFWAPWCGPCISEMKHSKILRETFKDKNVVFVYLACDCSAESWKSSIADNDIAGINLLLSDDALVLLRKRYAITGIPNYLLINKKGELVNIKAARPGDDKIKDEILELL
jgi:thiol-disulfide isomerase/thioredoxin